MGTSAAGRRALLARIVPAKVRKYSSTKTLPMSTMRYIQIVYDTQTVLRSLSTEAVAALQ